MYNVQDYMVVFFCFFLYIIM